MYEFTASNNDNYNYEKGMYSEINFHWDDKTKTLLIGNRKGNFPGMLISRKFNLVIVNRRKGTGTSLSDKIDKTISYKGEMKTLIL